MAEAARTKPWPALLLALLGVAALVLGWFYGVLGWYLGAVLLAVALAMAVTALGVSRWWQLVPVALVVALVALPALTRPDPDVQFQLPVADPWVSTTEDVLITLEQNEQTSTLTAWSASDGQQLWTLSQDAAALLDSPYPMPLVVGEVLLTGTLTEHDVIGGWPTLGAFEVSTGQQLWDSEVHGAVLGVAGDVLVVSTPGYAMDHARAGRVQGVDLATGEVRWAIDGVLPTAGVPVLGTDSEHPRWGGYLDFGQELALLALREMDEEDTPEAGTQLVDPVSGDALAQLPTDPNDGVLVLGEQALVVVDEGQGEHVTSYGADGEQLWSAEVDQGATEVNGLDMLPSRAVMTAGDRVLLDGVSAALDLRTGEQVQYPVRPLPGRPEYILVGSQYALTPAASSSGYAVLVDLASGEVREVPGELSGTGRPDAFYGGERAALLYSDVVDGAFGRTVCRVRMLDAATMTTSEHLLGECAEEAAVDFWGGHPMAAVDGSWAALASH